MSAKPRRIASLLLLAVPAFLLAGLAVLVVLSRRPGEVGPVDGALRPCPPTPNCACSQEAAPEQRVEPLVLGASDPLADFARLVDVAAEQPGARLVTREEGYAHLVFTTPLLRFQDDLELLLDEDGQLAHVRSASRVGRSDLGANAERVEALRSAWVFSLPADER